MPPLFDAMAPEPLRDDVFEPGSRAQVTVEDRMFASTVVKRTRAIRTSAARIVAGVLLLLPVAILAATMQGGGADTVVERVTPQVRLAAAG